ncbi:MAG: hypothetical protein ACKVK0_00095 [Pirellulales bacterium]|jgi:hypothetical protein
MGTIRREQATRRGWKLAKTLSRIFRITRLQLLGPNDNQLAYYHAGHCTQLSQFGGNMIEDLIA